MSNQVRRPDATPVNAGSGIGTSTGTAVGRGTGTGPGTGPDGAAREAADPARGPGGAPPGVPGMRPARRGPMRADARRNYQRLLATARVAFAEHGTDAPLEEVARRAGVGIGTLYRHFPNRHALMSAVFEDAVCDLLDRSRALLGAAKPCDALVTWLRALIMHAGEYRGLSRALMSACHDDSSALARCSTPMQTAGLALLTRAQQAEAVRPDVSIGDLMQLTNAIALAAEASPDDPQLVDRLLGLTLRGLMVRSC